jgi:hypothetical protein
MLLDDDVMADGQTKTRPFPGRLGRKERIEHLLLRTVKTAEGLNKRLKCTSSWFRQRPKTNSCAEVPSKCRATREHLNRVGSQACRRPRASIVGCHIKEAANLGGLNTLRERYVR